MSEMNLPAEFNMNQDGSSGNKVFTRKPKRNSKRRPKNLQYPVKIKDSEVQEIFSFLSQYIIIDDLDGSLQDEDDDDEDEDDEDDDEDDEEDDDDEDEDEAGEDDDDDDDDDDEDEEEEGDEDEDEADEDEDELIQSMLKLHVDNRIKSGHKSKTSSFANKNKSTSSPRHSDKLIQNFQVRGSKKPVKISNRTEFSNVEPVKKSVVDSNSHLERRRKFSQKKTSQPSQNAGKKNKPTDYEKKYRNLDLIKRNQEKYVANKSVQNAVPKNRELSHGSKDGESSHQEAVDKGKKWDKYVKPPSNSKKGKKKKFPKEELAESHNRKEKVFWNSNFNRANDGDDEKPDREPSSRHPVENRRPGRNDRNIRNRPSFADLKFPKYLSREEMNIAAKFGLLLSGIIRINPKNFNEAYITAPDKGMDIFINGLLDRNRALEGDEVYYVLKDQEHFRVFPDSAVQRTAVVVAMKNFNHNRAAIGSLKATDKKSSFAMFSPRDCRIPRIRIRKNDWPPGFSENPESFERKLFYAKISQWDNIRYAEGKILKEVGLVGDIETETSAIMLMFDLDENPHPESFGQFYPKAPFLIPDSEYSDRRDLRKECIFTIDPATAKDLDDAVSLKVLPNGNYEIGVHISDVTYFLYEGSPLDAAVSKRATTVYLVQKVYHMLPRELCELCSLLPGEDKLAFSVFWEITPDFRILSHFFTRSIINSCAQLSYEQVQCVLDGSEMSPPADIKGNHSVKEIADAVKLLNEIAIHLRKMRFTNGALRIDQTKITFNLDDFGLPLNYSVYENKESHRLIEEFMLLANITVAERINSCYPKIAFLRSHSPPSPFLLKRIMKDVEKWGIDLDVSSSKALNSSLQKYSSKPDSEGIMMVLNRLLAKPMARAKYYCADTCTEDEDRRHYALNVSLYTHFTSPIRRYADVMVHRLLAASLGYRKKPKWSADDVEKIAANCNKQKYAAKMAGEKSTELFLVAYIIQKGPFTCDAVVCDIKNKFMDCIVLENGLLRRIYFENIKGKVIVDTQNEAIRLTIHWAGTKEASKGSIQIVQIFSTVKIKLRKGKELKIKAKLMPNEP